MAAQRLAAEFTGLLSGRAAHFAAPRGPFVPSRRANIEDSHLLRLPRLCVHCPCAEADAARCVRCWAADRFPGFLWACDILHHRWRLRKDHCRGGRKTSFAGGDADASLSFSDGQRAGECGRCEGGSARERFLRARGSFERDRAPVWHSSVFCMLHVRLLRPALISARARSYVCG